MWKCRYCREWCPDDWGRYSVFDPTNGQTIHDVCYACSQELMNMPTAAELAQQERDAQFAQQQWEQQQLQAQREAERQQREWEQQQQREAQQNAQLAELKAKLAQITAETLKLVNNTNSKIWYCLVYWFSGKSGLQKAKTGWWSIEPGTVKQHHQPGISFDTDGCFGIYAHNDDSSLEWGDGSYGSFEIISKIFDNTIDSTFKDGYTAKFTQVNGRSFIFNESNAERVRPAEAPQKTEFKLINSTSHKINAAILYTSTKTDGYVKAGWYAVEANSTLSKKIDGKGFLGAVHAEAADGSGLEWGDGTAVDIFITNNAFGPDPKDEQYADGYSAQFTFIENKGTSFTFTESNAEETSAKAAKFCGDCGAKLAAGEKFCGECGAAVK